MHLDFSYTREGYIGESLCGHTVQFSVKSPLCSLHCHPARGDQSARGCLHECTWYNSACMLYNYALDVSGCTQPHMHFFITVSQEKLEPFKYNVFMGIKVIFFLKLTF